MKFNKMKMIFTTVVLSIALTACSTTLPPEVLTALTKDEKVDPDANTFVMKGDWECKSAPDNCEIRVPMGGNNQSASTERLRMLISYYNNQDTALDYFRAFTPFLSQGLNIWDSNRRDKRNNSYLLKQLESQSNEQMALYGMIGGMSLNASNSSSNIANSGFEMFGQLASSNATTFESIFNAQGETTRSIFEFMPEGGDTISNNYSYDYNDAFNQYDGSFNPATTNQALQPINWDGLTSFAGVFKPIQASAAEDEVE
jgi:hypothetical protein